MFSYYKKTKGLNNELFEEVNSEINLSNIKTGGVPKIIITNGAVLKECMQQIENGLVYLWSPKCSSKICYPLDVIQKECNNYGLELFIVAEYYDNELMNKNYNIDRPILGIDISYYKTNLTSKYLSKFIEDLTLQKDINDKFIFLKNGSFTKSFENIGDISLLLTH
jgi:hypothetical protein